MTRVLVAEDIGASGIELLEEHFDVDTAFSDDKFDLEKQIGDYDGLLIRSATKVTADLIDKATQLKAIGRAGVGVDNVDVDAATKRGIVVANAPQSNVVTAAEHTMALLLALARNVPQAHAALVGGEWARSKYSGVELQDKVLGILGFGRIGQLVAARAAAFGMQIVAYDPFVSAERYKELGVEMADSPDQVLAVADFLTLHLPNTPDTKNFLNKKSLAKCKDGVRVLNVARGPLVNEADLEAALKSGKVAGAALDVFSSEPVTESPLFGLPNVIVTPHLGASTAEATDRAGFQAAEQVVAALTDGFVTTAVNIPAIAPEDLEVLGPYVPLCQMLGGLAVAMTPANTLDKVEVELMGRISDYDTRPLVTGALLGVLAAQSDIEVNEVNAPGLAEARGIEVAEKKTSEVRDFTNLVRVTVTTGDERHRVAGTVIGRQNRPHLLEVWGERFNIELASEIALFRYHDVPGMIGKVGTCMGEADVNIVSATVGRPADDELRHDTAVIVLATDGPTPPEAVKRILAIDGITDGFAISL
jgi:D-3-phosphoglycerate dehydrogenase